MLPLLESVLFCVCVFRPRPLSVRFRSTHVSAHLSALPKSRAPRHRPSDMKAMAADKTLSVEIGYWMYINICLNVLKYVICNILRILCRVIATTMFTLSSLLASLSEKLQTTDSVENLTQQIDIKYCKQNHEKNIKSCRVSVTKDSVVKDVTINNILPSDSLETISNKQFIEEKIVEKSSTEVDEINTNEIHNIKTNEENTEQKFNPEIDGKHLREKLNTQVKEEIINQKCSFEVDEKNSYEKHNSETSEENWEQEFNSEVVEKSLYEKFDTKTNEEKEQKYNAEISTINMDENNQNYKHIDKTEVPMSMELVVKDAIINNILPPDTLETIFNNKVNEENTELEWSAEVDREESDEKSNLEASDENVEQKCDNDFGEENLNEISNSEVIEENFKHKFILEVNEEKANNRSNSEIAEKKSEEIYNSSYDETSAEITSTTVYDTIKAQKKCPIKRNAALFLITKTLKESEKHFKKHLSVEEKFTPKKQTNMENGKTRRGNRDVREYKKPISINEKLLPLNVIEIHCDALSLPSDFALAICITEDFHFFTSNAVDFKHKFGSIGKLMDQNLCVGDVGQIIHNDQYVFYLIVREKYKRTSSANILEKSLINLRIKMETLKLTKLAIPKNGFDCINLRDATILISKIFATSNIEISICLMISNSDIYRIHPPKINSTTNQLWEMESQTDLIMFVNMEQMYMDDWNDPVINNVDLKYPFKNKLLEDINIKPMAAGDVLSYIIDREILFCVFTNPVDQNQSYFECLEQAFKKIKSQLPGYRFLAIQRESLDNEYTINDTSRIVLLLQTIFNHLNAEIWICNDTDSNKVDQFKHYNKFVTSSIETSNKEYSKIVFKPKVKPFRKKSNTDHTTNAYGFVKNYSNKNHHDNTEIY